MDFIELKSALGAGRSGIRALNGRLEAVPMEILDGVTSRIALRSDTSIECSLEAPWRRTVALAFSTSGEHLVAAGATGGVRIWDARNGAVIATLADPEAWVLGDGRACLPVRFAVRDRFLVMGGRTLSVVETSGWNILPIADFPVVAIVPSPVHAQMLIGGPEEEGTFPVECLALDTFTLSARRPIYREHPSSTTFLPGVA